MLYLLSLNCFHEIRKVKSGSRVRLFVTLWTVAYQAPPSMGFSRQEYWSGLSFPSLSQDKESEVGQLRLTLCDPMDCSLPGSSIHGILQARLLEWVAISFSRGSSPPGDLPNPGIEPRSPTLQADASTSEPPGGQI